MSNNNNLDYNTRKSLRKYNSAYPMYFCILQLFTLTLARDDKQVGQLSQPNCAAACVSFGKNVSAKSVHLTLLYPTALTSTYDHLTVLPNYVCT